MGQRDGGAAVSQTQIGSFVEAWANIGVGFAINFCANLVVLPLFGFSVRASEAFGIGIIFTVISLVRSYVLRRWFNGLKFGNTPDLADEEEEEEDERHPPLMIGRGHP